VVCGLFVRRGRTSGSVRYPYTRQANATAAAPIIVRPTRLRIGRIASDVSAAAGGGSAGRTTPATSPGTTVGMCAAVSSGDDDLEPLSRSGLIGNGMPVHDREGRGLGEAASF